MRMIVCMCMCARLCAFMRFNVCACEFIYVLLLNLCACAVWLVLSQNQHCVFSWPKMDA